MSSPPFLLLSGLFRTHPHKTPNSNQPLFSIKPHLHLLVMTLSAALTSRHCQPAGTKFYLLSPLGRQITWHICFLGKVYPSMFNFTSLEHSNKGQTHHEPQGSTGARAVPDSMPCPPSAPPGPALKYQDLQQGRAWYLPTHVTYDLWVHMCIHTCK